MTEKRMDKLVRKEKMDLQKLFPMIRTREEVLSLIHENEELNQIFAGWERIYQKEFLDFCTGVRGIKILYDSFFKEIFNPEYTPERLNELLSLLIGETVKIVMILPNDSTRIADEKSLLVMDMVVELEDGSIANVEVQKIGYLFPGQRSACYSSDLLLRQYKRLRGERGKHFSYKDIKTVYTIVFFERSPKEFHKQKKNYIHKFEQKSDTGLEMELLQKYCFIALDIFREKQHNKDIMSELDAWLVFLGMDEPEMIEKLIGQYPKFRSMYEDIYDLCQNVGRVMKMFSKELQELDRNTVQYMIDEMHDEINEKQGTIIEQQGMINKQQDIIEEQNREIEKLKQLILEKRSRK